MTKSTMVLLLWVATATTCCAQAVYDYIPLSGYDLDQLTARIALYPDAMLSDVLVACTYPLDVVKAAQWLKAGGAASAIDAQDWDDSVKALAHYPDVLNEMASDAE